MPNGDIDPGDTLLITNWVGEREKVMVMTPSGPQASDIENRGMHGDVLEVLAVDYPDAICRVHSVRTELDYTCGVMHLKLTDFECRRASPEYVAAVVSQRSPRFLWGYFWLYWRPFRGTRLPAGSTAPRRGSPPPPSPPKTPTPAQ